MIIPMGVNSGSFASLTVSQLRVIVHESFVKSVRVAGRKELVVAGTLRPRIILLSSNMPGGPVEGAFRQRFAHNDDGVHPPGVAARPYPGREVEWLSMPARLFPKRDVSESVRSTRNMLSECAARKTR